MMLWFLFTTSLIRTEAKGLLFGVVHSFVPQSGSAYTHNFLLRTRGSAPIIDKRSRVHTKSFRKQFYSVPPTSTYQVGSNKSEPLAVYKACDPSVEEGESSDEKQRNELYSFPGKHKWLGGAVDPTTGCIYGVPSHATSVICLRPPNNKSQQSDCYDVQMIPLPASVATGKFKWLRGIIVDGYLFGIPAWADCVLRVNIAKLSQANDDGESSLSEEEKEDIVQLIPLPEGTFVSPTGEETNGEPPTRWLWHGAALNQNKTAIYCIPSNAYSILKIDLSTLTTSLLPLPPSSGIPLSLTNKWYGGILGHDNAVYGVPYAAGGVLRIDCDTDTVSIIGNYGLKEYNWHGGVLCPKTGALYAFPSHSPFVLKIDTKRGTSSNITTLLKIHRAAYDDDNVTRYKWLGGSIGADGLIYGMPSDASTVLKIDTETDICTTFGTGISGEKNKWQGGVLAKDGFIYAIPSNAKNVLQIDTRVPKTKEEEKLIDGEIQYSDASRVTLLGNLSETKDKWQGGFIGNDDSIYGIPENEYHILRIPSPSCTEGGHTNERTVEMI